MICLDVDEFTSLYLLILLWALDRLKSEKKSDLTFRDIFSRLNFSKPTFVGLCSRISSHFQNVWLKDLRGKYVNG